MVKNRIVAAAAAGAVLVAVSLSSSALAGPYSGPIRDPWPGDGICALIVDDWNHIYVDAADAPPTNGRSAITSFNLVPAGWQFVLPADVPSGGSATPTAITYSDSLGLQGAWDFGAIAPESQYDSARNFAGSFSTMTYTVYGSSTVRTFEYSAPFPEPSASSIFAAAAMMGLRRARSRCVDERNEAEK
jgi:hypothetical protein